MTPFGRYIFIHIHRQPAKATPQQPETELEQFELKMSDRGNCAYESIPTRNYQFRILIFHKILNSFTEDTYSIMDILLRSIIQTVHHGATQTLEASGQQAGPQDAIAMITALQHQMSRRMQNQPGMIIGEPSAGPSMQNGDIPQQTPVRKFFCPERTCSRSTNPIDQRLDNFKAHMRDVHKWDRDRIQNLPYTRAGLPANAA